jgi:hypothetical protein
VVVHITHAGCYVAGGVNFRVASRTTEPHLQA